MRISSYVALDLETSGLNPKRDKIIEIGAVKIIDGEIQDHYVTFVNAGIRISEEVSTLTGITEEQLAGGREMEEALRELILFIAGMPLLGHRILFDYSFIKKFAVNQSIEFEAEGIDTLKIARKYLPDLESRRLDYLCSYYGITHRAHRALDDAMAAHLLYQRLCKDFDTENEAGLFASERLRCSFKKEGPAGKLQKQRLYDLISRHKLVMDFDVEKLTKNEVSRYTDKILSEYGR